LTSVTFSQECAFGSPGQGGPYRTGEERAPSGRSLCHICSKGEGVPEEEIALGVAPDGIGCPLEVTRVRRVAQASSVPKISWNQSCDAIEPWYT